MGRVGGRGQEDRPRERALREGVAVLSDRELLAAVLGVGGPAASAQELAEDLAARGLRRLARATPGELLQTGGLGPAQAARLAAAFELGRRAAARGPGGRRLDSSRALARVARQRLQGEEHEVVLVLLLTAGLRLLRTVPVARGGGCAAAFAPADVLRVAIREGAPRLALAHNHPAAIRAPARPTCWSPPAWRTRRASWAWTWSTTWSSATAGAS